MPRPPKSRSETVDRVRSLLTTRGLSLAELSRQSRQRFPANRLFRIPSNFYDVLRRPSFTPSLHQVYALSVLTGYPVADWLSVFGFSFDGAARFQASLPQKRTVELDARVYDPMTDVAWFERDIAPSFGVEPAPLSDWLSGTAIRSLGSLRDRPTGSSRYLKIGSRDVYAFPELLPGSIVRVNREMSAKQLLAEDKNGRILAIAAGQRIFCGRLRPVRDGRVVLCSRQLSYPPMEWTLETEARILGYIDIEIRPLGSRQAPEVPASWRGLSGPRRPRTNFSSRPFGVLIRSARLRSGLSLHEASERTRLVARVLRDGNYFCASATLSDLESGDLVPRHIHKWISVSAVYCISLAELTEAAGLPLEHTANKPSRMPQRSMGSSSVAAPPGSPFLQRIADEFREIPFFLRKALPSYLELPALAIQDFFWAGATDDLAHPYLKNSAFLVVDSKSKTPALSTGSPMWAQPFYMLQLRGGKRLFAPCHVEDGTLVLRSCTTKAAEILRLHYPSQVEVLGKVIAVARRL
jgi:transcriptional regulator with XRE-family HTH domain